MSNTYPTPFKVNLLVNEYYDHFESTRFLWTLANPLTWKTLISSLGFFMTSLVYIFEQNAYSTPFIFLSVISFQFAMMLCIDKAKEDKWRVTLDKFNNRHGTKFTNINAAKKRWLITRLDISEKEMLEKAEDLDSYMKLQNSISVSITSKFIKNVITESSFSRIVAMLMGMSALLTMAILKDDNYSDITGIDVIFELLNQQTATQLITSIIFSASVIYTSWFLMYGLLKLGIGLWKRFMERNDSKTNYSERKFKVFISNLLMSHSI